MVYDAQRQMLTNVILLQILYMVCIKNKMIVIILMMKERKESSIHYYLLLKYNR